MNNKIIDVLQKRGAAEIVNGKVCQVTQAIDETDSEVKYITFGNMRKQKIIPIDEACSTCQFWKNHFESTAKCQERQSKDAWNRNFFKMICPKQLQD